MVNDSAITVLLEKHLYLKYIKGSGVTMNTIKEKSPNRFLKITNYLEKMVTVQYCH